MSVCADKASEAQRSDMKCQGPEPSRLQPALGLRREELKGKSLQQQKALLETKSYLGRLGAQILNVDSCAVGSISPNISQKKKGSHCLL